jgi:hypothetical protein
VSAHLRTPLPGFDEPQPGAEESTATTSALETMSLAWVRDRMKRKLARKYLSEKLPPTDGKAAWQCRPRRLAEAFKGALLRIFFRFRELLHDPPFY